MEIKPAVIDRIKSQLTALTKQIYALQERVTTIEALLSLADTNQQQTIASPMQGTSTVSSSSDEVPLRQELLYEGRRIPAAGTAAAALVATARAEAAELKRVASECTESE